MGVLEARTIRCVPEVYESPDTRRGVGQKRVGGLVGFLERINVSKNSVEDFLAVKNGLQVRFSIF